MIAPGGKSRPEVTYAPRRSAGWKDRWPICCDRCREGSFETVIVSPCEVAPQDRRSKFVRLQDRGTKLHTGATEEFEIRASVAPWTKLVDFAGDPDHSQSVSFLQRDRIPQDRQMPRMQRTGVPLHDVNG
jgi:hypothetical protein